MSRIVKLSILLSLIFVVRVNSNSLNLIQPRARFSLFDGLSCSTCEGVLNVVQRQIPKTEKLGTMGKTAIKLAIKGACAYYTLGVPPALALCTAMTNKLADFLADDVLGRTGEIDPKSNCQSIGMCPPCKSSNNKLVLAHKKPNLPLPWETHNKAQHVQMWQKYEAEQTKKVKLRVKKMSLNVTLLYANSRLGWPSMPNLLPQQITEFNVKCYGCKSVLGLVAHDISNVRTSGRDMVVSLVKQQCLNYVTGIPFSEKICDTMAQKSVGKLADEIMVKGEILPGANCRAIGMCPACFGTCDDEVEVEKGKKAKDTPLPPEDQTCDEPPVLAGIPCTDNYPAQCKQGNTTCENTVYERMMRMECMFTCVCRWLPKFSDLTAYLPGK